MNKKSALMITLGHNSSAVYFDGDKTVIGYEEERINRIKSSSAYPRLSLDEIEKHVKIEPGSYIFVSHWFDKFDFHTETSKYFDKQHFDSLVVKYSLKTVHLGEDFTHHDAHAMSALSFMRDQWDVSKHSSQVVSYDKFHIIAADGFGNSQEVISVYSTDSLGTVPQLVNRYYGYQYSLGLMYQFATSFCGMKENQDEYKFLGYETHVSQLLDSTQIDLLRSLAVKKSQEMFDTMQAKPDGRPENWKTDGLANIDYLKTVKQSWNEHYADVLSKVAPSITGRDVRIAIGHYIQEVIEGVLAKIVSANNMKHVALSGGIFYNVKLNNKVLNSTSGVFSVVPLAGDQGCGMGMYEAFVGGFKWGDLKWGPRPEFADWDSCISPSDLKKYGSHIRHYSSNQRSTAIDDTVDLVSRNKLVNVVKSRMEFGPRALCSTTTLSIPTTTNVMIINDLNERDTVMPMAPVMLDSAIDEFFDKDISKRVVGSDKYMILTYNYLNPDLENYGGIAHKYPNREVWSGRPQRVTSNDTFMFEVLSKIYPKSKALINTSFNAHGRPIVYAIDSVLDSFKFEFDKAQEMNLELPYLFLCDFDG